MLTSRPLPLEKLLMLMLPGKLNTTDKRDSHSIPQLRPGLLTCQTMLLKTEISTSKPQLQSRKFSVMPPRPKPPLRRKPTQRKRRRERLPQLKLLHHSSNSTEAETLPKRELPLSLSQSHQDLNHLELPAAHHPPTPIELDQIEEKIDVF